MEFMKSAKEFTRNPLGIIALFISLIYGFASLLLNSTVEKLTECERFLLILFIVIFPVLVLGTFYFLVTKHHWKLYAPNDYRDDSSFLRTLTPEEKNQKVEEEAKEAFEKNDVAFFENESFVAQSSKFEEFVDEIKDIEARAVRKVSRELGAEFKEDVGIGGTGVSFDAAVFNDPMKIVCIEVKVFKTPTPSLAILERLLNAATIANDYFKGKFKLYVVVVYSFPESELRALKDSWLARIHAFPVDIEAKFMSKGELYNA